MYSNEEGIATKESQLTYDSRVDFLSSTTIVLSWLGLGASLFNEGYAKQQPSTNNMQLALRDNIIWFFISLHSLTLRWNACPIRCYNVGLRGAMLAVMAIANNLYTQSLDAGKSSIISTSSSKLFLAVALIISQLLLPRTPCLFTLSGKAVDVEHSSSAIDRYFMLWCRGALRTASESARLDRLPALNYRSRSKTQPLITISRNTLWKHVLAERYRSFAKQWVLMALRSVVTFGSPFCLMLLLKCLENGHTEPGNAWIWLIGIGVFSTCETVIHYHQAWIQWSEMGIPIRAQLIMTIYRKALRMKDSKDPESVKTKNCQDTPEFINLVSSDTLSFSKFTAVHYILPLSFAKFLFAVGFLFNLLGWQGTLAALVITAASIPINTKVIKQERTAQRKLKVARDKKTKMANEALHALRQIKFYAFEAQWEEQINCLREEELACLRKTFLAHNIRAIWKVASPLLVAALSIFTYAVMMGEVTPSIIFPMIELLPHLQGTLGTLPLVVQDYLSARSNAHRMDVFLRRPDQEQFLKPSSSGCVVFKNASFTWPSHQDKSDSFADNSKGVSHLFSLRNIDAEFPVGELSIIYGETGCGKSLLLSAIIGEVELLEGSIKAPSAAHGQPVAIVSQSPWLQNATIQNNVLFGHTMNLERYEKVLRASALLPDLAVLREGDQTRIGSRGVKLSGGQRARLSFAQALYSDSKTIVLDDIFSALDTHVAKRIFDALTGPLCEGRTRILATHQIALCLSKTKYIVLLESSTIKSAGPAVSTDVLPSQPESDPKPSPRTEQESVDVPTDKKPNLVKRATMKDRKADLDASSDKRTFQKYLEAAGGAKFVLLFTFSLITKQLLSAIPTWTLGRINHLRPKSSSTTPDDSGLQQYVFVYLLSSVAATTMEFLANAMSQSGSIRASRFLYRQMTYKVIRMPLLWLDTTPIGEILRRFSADHQAVDDFLLATVSDFSDCFVKMLTIIGAGIYMSMYTAFLTIALLYLGARVGGIYIKARKVVKRADANPTAQILDNFTTTAAGLSTIRAYGATDRFIEGMHKHIDELSLARRHFWIFNRWLGLQMSLIGILFSMGTGVILLWSNSTIIDPSLIGFSLTFSMGFSGVLFKAVNNFGSLETYIAAAGAVTAYTELEPEDQSGGIVPEDWPSKGELEIDHLEAAYSDDSPLVLKGISFNVNSGQRIGIVGRTGAGKSSLTLSLLRLIEPRGGSIKIDGIDISTIKLRDLRSRIAFVPQDPVLFSGTVRSNLDYFRQHSDARLNGALRRVKLLATYESDDQEPFGNFGLDFAISAGGANLSHGQRQLLCLARVLVQDPKIVVLDEATSAVDDETDKWIQETIRTELKQTLIVVAHRLRTVATFDRVIVLNDGEIVEQGRPADLLKAKGAFFELVNSSEDRDVLSEMIRSA